MTSTGREAATTLNHRFHTLGLEMTLPCRSPKGHSLFQNSTTTARMAPSWMTTRNMDINSSLALNLTTCSTRIMCPVEEMGSHSVMPSTIPIRIALMISKNVINPSCSTRWVRSFFKSSSSIPYYEPLCIQIIEIFRQALYLSAPGNVLYYKNKKSVRFLRPALKALRTTR